MKTPSLSESWLTLRSRLASGAADPLALVDVRSEGEFALGAIPGAVNLPLFDDAERHQVGLTYKTVSPLAATQLGIELFAAKAAAYRERLATAAAGRALAVHCWRGGMRSQSVALWLGTMGPRPVLLRGGYKAYRRAVLDVLDALAARELLVLDGRTGAGKSALLRRFPPGFPLLDFEGLARHRGSVFGDFAQAAAPPTQQDFENQLADAALRLPPAGPVLVEIETLLGPVTLPHRLRQRILSAPVVLVERAFDDRVARITAEYAAAWDAAADRRFLERLELLHKHLPTEHRAAIAAAVGRRDFAAAVSMLLRLRYDKVYDKGLAKRAANVVARFDLTADEDAAVDWIRRALGGKIR